MTGTPEERYARWRTSALIVWTLLGAVVLGAALLWGLGRILSALVPFIIALIVVFLLNAPVRWLAHRGMKRSYAALACLVAGLAIIGAILTLLGPPVMHQISSFARTAPRYFTQVQRAESAVEGRVSTVVLPPWLTNVIKSASASLSEFVVVIGNGAAHAIVSTGSHIALGLLDVFLAIVIAFWVLTDLPKMREELVALAGPRYEADAEHLLGTVTRVLGGYLRGQTVASFCTAVIVTIGLTIFRVPYASVLGMIAFFLNFAPYIGPVITGLIAGLLGMTVSPITALIAVGCVIVAQNVTDGLIMPRVMSSQVDLHPTLVIFSLLVGGALFGIPGLVFAIPVAAIAKGLFVYYYERRTERSLSSSNGALFRDEVPSGDTPAESDTDTGHE